MIYLVNTLIFAVNKRVKESEGERKRIKENERVHKNEQNYESEAGNLQRFAAIGGHSSQ